MDTLQTEVLKELKELKEVLTVGRVGKYAATQTCGDP
jgi:hypothetical protein